MKRKLSSVRLRLTLWNIAVLTLALVGFAVIVHFTVQAILLRSVDRDLAREAGAVFPPKALFLGRSLPETPPESHVLYMRQEPGKFTMPLDRLPVPTPPPFSDRHDFIFLRVLDLEGHDRETDREIGLKKTPIENGPWDPVRFAQATAGREQIVNVTWNRQEMRVLYRPIKENGRITGAVQVAYPLTELRNLLRGLDWTLFGLIPLALLAAGLGGAFLTNRALRPVREITQAASEVEARDLSRRLPVSGGDEFAELATTFNGMFGRLETAFAHLEAAVEQQRRFVADASHELRTPLTTIKANASWALRKERGPAEYREALTAADCAAEKMGRLIESLLCLARSDQGRLTMESRPLRIQEVLESARNAFPPDPAYAPILLDACDPDLSVMGDPLHLERLFVNLLENAVRHTPAEGRIRLTAQAHGRQVIFTVADTGEGIPPEHLPHLGERFYRVDAARVRSRGGAGLGLAICRSIVQAHGGTLEIQSAPGIGTTVTITLPL